MNAPRPAIDNRVLGALHVAALIFSTSVTAAELSPNSVEWPRGDGWTFQAGPQEAAHAAHDWEVPDSPLLPDILTPKIKIVAPAAFKLNITLTIRRNGRPVGDDVRPQRRAGQASHAACPRHKFRLPIAAAE